MEVSMNRDAMLQALTARSEPWDILVIGGGATGLGIAVDAAARGYRTALVSRVISRKDVQPQHQVDSRRGPLLATSNVGLVLEALRERGLLTQNAPHLVNHLSFIVPNYTWWKRLFTGSV